MSQDEVHFVSESALREPIPTNMKYLLEPIEQISSFHADGRINVECTCLQSAFAHRCGHLMRDAISCFNNSKKTPRGAECEEKFMLQAICVGVEKND